MSSDPVTKGSGLRRILKIFTDPDPLNTNDTDPKCSKSLENCILNPLSIIRLYVRDFLDLNIIKHRFSPLTVLNKKSISFDFCYIVLAN